MNTEMIVKKLQALGCDAWELADTREKGWEFYFIRHALDQNRATNVRTIRVNVYRKLEEGKFLGRASGEIPPTASEAELDKALADLYFQAGLVRNPAYELNGEKIPAELGGDGGCAGRPVDAAAIAEDFIRALASVPESPEADINSYEIFVKEIDRRFRNSRGVEYRCVYPSSEIEVVVNARRQGHEIEIFRVFDCGTCDAEKLAADVRAAMKYGTDRLDAVPTPELPPMAVVFSTDDSVSLYQYFAERMTAEMKVRKMSDWEAGRPVSSAFSGDRVSIEALAELPNSSKNFPVDGEGAAIRGRFLIRDGVAENFWGGRQFSSYMGLEGSSLVYNFRVSGGTKSAEEIRGGDYLEVVEFSDFQVDEVGCDFAGEIRLGYLHRGGETKIVTGGSVSGDMREAVKTMTFTRDTVQYDTCAVPALTRLEGVKITGAE